MSFAQEPIFQWLAQYAYEPEMVYLAVCGMMIASGFGLPIPEEVTIISAGILAYMGANPQIFPPPYPGAPVLDGYQIAFFTMFMVMLADSVVFAIGRIFGRRLMIHPKFSRVFKPAVMEKIQNWTNKYGAFAAFLFRFTPGVRFPAHLALGMSPLPLWKFIAVDGFAALISVPTQVLLIYHYGEPILAALHKFKIYIGTALLIGGVLYIGYRLVQRFKLRPTT
jgi:membrane protein DedA with SNARE-associated domain